MKYSAVLLACISMIAGCVADIDVAVSIFIIFQRLFCKSLQLVSKVLVLVFLAPFLVNTTAPTIHNSPTLSLVIISVMLPWMSVFVCLFFIFELCTDKDKGKVVYSSSRKRLTATGTHVPYGIIQCNLALGRGDIPAFTPAETGTRCSDPGGMQGWVNIT